MQRESERERLGTSRRKSLLQSVLLLGIEQEIAHSAFLFFHHAEKKFGGINNVPYSTEKNEKDHMHELYHVSFCVGNNVIIVSYAHRTIESVETPFTAKLSMPLIVPKIVQKKKEKN